MVRGEEEILEPLPGKPTWSGSISMGLVNIPVMGFPNHHRAKGPFECCIRSAKLPISYRLFTAIGKSHSVVLDDNNIFFAHVEDRKDGTNPPPVNLFGTVISSRDH